MVLNDKNPELNGLYAGSYVQKKHDKFVVKLNEGEPLFLRKLDDDAFTKATVFKVQQGMRFIYDVQYLNFCTN